jgi:GNAT superfamily N-acetyltransferase
VDLTVRDATQGDAGAIAVLLGDMGYPASAETAADLVRRFAEHQGSRLQVADSRDGVVGLVATQTVPRLDSDYLSCRVTDLVVSASHRRQGVGGVLLAAAEREARRIGATRLDLSSGDWRDDAHAFYGAMGFETRARSFTKRLATETGPPPQP